MSELDTLNIELNIKHKTQFPRQDNPKIFMNVLSLNIQSICNKINDFTTFVQNSMLKFHVIVLSETHIRENQTQFYNLPGYEAEHCVRKSGHFGGVSIFVRKDFSSFNLIHKLDLDMHNSLLINLEKFNIKIAAFYHCRSSSLDSFLTRLDYVLDTYDNCYVFGDFNIDLSKLSSDNRARTYFDLVQSNGYVFLNNFSIPTRINHSRNTATCIDHIITDAIFHEDNLTFTVSVDDLFGDHKALLLSIFKPNTNISQKTHYIEMKKILHDKIISQNLIAKVSQDNFNSFQSDLRKVLSNNTVVYRQKEKFNAPFMNIQTLNFIKIKHNYYKLMKKYPSSSIVNNRYRFYRNLVSKKTTELKKNYYQKQFDNCHDNPKETWSKINNLLRNTDSKKSQTCTAIKINNITITNRTEIVERFNSFFTTAADSIHNNLMVDYNIQNTLLDCENYNIPVPFHCALTTPEEILQIISELSNSSAEDCNNFSNKFFKKYRVAFFKFPRMSQNCKSCPTP